MKPEDFSFSMAKRVDQLFKQKGENYGTETIRHTPGRRSPWPKVLQRDQENHQIPRPIHLRRR
jgi:hypothetical protein